MTRRTAHSLEQGHVTAQAALRLYRAWAGLGQEVVARPVALSWQAGGRMAEQAAERLLGAWNPEGLAVDVAREYANLAQGLMTVPSAAARAAVAQFDTPGRDPQEQALSGSAPPETVAGVVIDHDIARRQRRELAALAGHAPDDPALTLPPRAGDAPFLMPARVLDASQAWASWFVPVAAAQRLTEDAVRTGHQPAEVLQALAPVAVGAGEAMVTLLVSDYCASDFGVTQEIGLTLTVTPRGGGFPDPGQIFLRLVVTDPFSLAAARQIWGIRKDFWNNAAATTPRGRIEAAYAADRMRMGFGARLPGAGGGALRIEFPRVGSGRSQDVPGVIYSMVDPHGPPAGPVAPARSILCRSGVREGLQVAGPVTLALPADRPAGQAAGCLCAGGMACLCDTLRGLGLDRRPPAANGWTERMTCTLDQPVPVADQPLGNSPATPARSRRSASEASRAE